MERWNWHCIVCDKILSQWTNDFERPDAPISEGILCFSSENPGSQKFNAQNEGDGELAFVVCDECLTQKANKVMHVVIRVETITNIQRKTLDGKSEQDEETA